MRVFRYILRFLGISFIILYFLASISRADDVTVNFPSTMTVNGEVQVEGLGMEGNPTYDATLTDSPSIGDVGISTTTTNNASNAAAESYAPTYISQYKKIKLWEGGFTPGNTAFGLGSYSPRSYTLEIISPQFNWGLLRNDFKLALFGANYVGTNGGNVLPNEQLFIPGVKTGAVNMNNATQTYLTSTVTDFTGTNNWSITMDWKDLAGISANANYSIFTSTNHYKPMLTFLFCEI